MNKGKKLRILMLEDVEEDVGLIKRELDKENILYENRVVDTRKEFMEELNHFKPEIILSDHSLPQFNSLEAFKICKEKNLDVPFILVSGVISDEFAIIALKEGVNDYVLKSNLKRLPVAIIQALEKKRLARRKRRAELELRNQNKMLLKINKELDNFIYQLSHNLKAPLLSVTGLINLIKLEGIHDREKLLDVIARMDRSIEKLNLTITDILNHSRNIRTQTGMELINIDAVIDNSFSDLQYMDGADGIIKNINIEQEVPFYSDSYRFEVICNNLISNAIKYYDPEKAKPHIDIRVTVTAKQATFVFMDNGIGIEKNLLPKIFDMFTRLTESREGSGLGMYIVKEMVSRLKGRIRITSEAGEGTTIQVILPNLNKESRH